LSRRAVALAKEGQRGESWLRQQEEIEYFFYFVETPDLASLQQHQHAKILPWTKLTIPHLKPKFMTNG